MVFKTLILLGFFFFTSEKSETYKVIGVHDGDTINVLNNDLQETKIRLEGIDCPELGQPFGMKAKQFVSDLCFNKNVRIDSKGKDRYGRTLAWVYSESGTCINLMLVENGLAWHFKKYSKDPYLASAELKARKLKINIWTELNPIAPWDFRHHKSK
ncbi:MAG: hypothetical protein RL641_264 [Candidatus Parcubacteria bacterium]|jgi:endonuclease YncB( thermonuclease family)